ncbi:acid protease [Earliella scabrosa]|nr:acid protease [Earliella scabrosa]
MPRRSITSLLAFLLTVTHVVTTVSATPVVQVNDNLVRLPVARQLNFTGANTILASDQARARHLRARADGQLDGATLPTVNALTSIPATNQAVTYTTTVSVGFPATKYSLIVDTGSSNTWVGASKTYKPGVTGKKTQNSVSVTYGSGYVYGHEYIDQVSLGASLTVPKQSIGVSQECEGFDGVDGILGLGPADLSINTLYPDKESSVPTLTDNLFKQKKIKANLVAVSFEPTNSKGKVNGELTFGGTDPHKISGSIHYAPITRTGPASSFWGIDQSIRYGTSTQILSKASGIVDTGTTLVLIADDAFEKYQNATGGTLDSATGLYKITPAAYAKLKSLFFTINGVTFELTPNAQIWPRALNEEIGGTKNAIYLIVGPLGQDSGQGFDFVNGMTFLERFYSVYDTANRRVGFAATPFTKATTN